MKRFFWLACGVIVLCAPLSPATADSTIVRLTSVLHQNFTGDFRNDDLAQELTPSGKLGQLVFIPKNRSRIWVIDPSLIDEVVAMSGSYKLATNAVPVGQQIALAWLSQLKRVSATNDVVALAYGNPDVNLANRVAPNELKLYYSFGKTELEIDLGRVVRSEPKGEWSIGTSKLNPLMLKNYSDNRKEITRLSRVVNSPDVSLLRVRLGRLLSPELKSASINYFSLNASTAVNTQIHRLRVNSGKYQITTEKSQLPVTVINDFPVEVKIDIQMLALNSRILVDDLVGVKLAANSKTQLELNAFVVAPGQTEVSAQITDDEGNEVGPISTLALNATVIDKRVIGFTTGAAILLLLAAITQSVRRVRKGRISEIK